MKQNLLEKLENLPYFSKGNLKLFQDNSDFSFDKNIQSWYKKKLIKKLKNGLYVTDRYISKQPELTMYKELIANTLVYPSYLSCEYVLQKHNLLTEATYTTTSITIKSTRVIENFLGTFHYGNLKKELFIGFQEIKYQKSTISIATKAKALFDFLYLKKQHFKNFSIQEINDLRLNLDELKKTDIMELKKYIQISGNTKLAKFYQNLKALL